MSTKLSPIAAAQPDTGPRSFTPDPELSEQLAQMTERALGRVAADAAVQRAQAQITALEQDVERLRAEAQWREAGWEEERAELLSRVHKAELVAAAQQARLEQARLDVAELEDEARCARGALEEAKGTLAAQGELLAQARGEAEQLHTRLLERERLLGAMWQTLKAYREQGPLQRLMRRPDMPDAAPKLISAADPEPEPRS